MVRRSLDEKVIRIIEKVGRICGGDLMSTIAEISKYISNPCERPRETTIKRYLIEAGIYKPTPRGTGYLHAKGAGCCSAGSSRARVGKQQKPRGDYAFAPMP